MTIIYLIVINLIREKGLKPGQTFHIIQTSFIWYK